jgi:hypothetical protein
MELKKYWKESCPSNSSSQIYLGPAHEIHDMEHFPSVSAIINESHMWTGIEIVPGLETKFDEAWFHRMTLMFQIKGVQNQLDELLTTGKSNGRSLKLQVMVLPPRRYFKIHAHPNIEFECTLKGRLCEFRWLFVVPPEKLTGENPIGPDIGKADMFIEEVVKDGECLVNEIGSVHQSFTAPDEGCAIIVMWSGCHANTHPSQVTNSDCRLQPHAGWENS